MPTKCPTCHVENPEEKPFCADCGTQLGISPDAPPSITRTLDLPTQGLEKDSVFAERYKIIEQLGEGGMGQVYRAHDTQIDEDIAIKVLRPEIALDKRILERFRNELKFARKITHKSVCRMHDISVSDGTTFITMEYVEGEDLKSVIKRKGKLGIGQALGVVMQIADGLVEAHNLGIVHRDLKPQNIMIDPEGNAKIMDFGIARSTQAEGVTQEGSIIGTPEYMSPEQVEGRTVDQRSDIYSLAVILYEMLTGQIPFSGKTVLDIALKHKSQKPDNPQQFNKKISDDLADLILRSMAKDPGDRYQSAEELLKALMSIEGTLPENERRAMRIAPRLHDAKTSTFSRRKNIITAVAGAAIIILGFIAWRVFFTPSLVKAAELPTVAILFINNNTGEPAHDESRVFLPEMMNHDLMTSKRLKTVTQERIYSFFHKKELLEARNYTEEDLKELAKEVRATHIIQGYLAKSGENLKLAVTLKETRNMDAVGAVDVEGRDEQSYFSMVEELTPKLKSLIGLTSEDIDTDFDDSISETMTSNLAALSLYAQAKWARATLKPGALDLLEKALDLDPDFAMAYWLRGMILVNQNNPKDGRASLRQAYEAIQQRPVTIRDRLTIEGMYFWLCDLDLVKAEKIFNEQVEKFPDDYFGNHYLGIMYFWSYGDREKAREHFEVLVNSGQAEIHEFDRLAMIFNGRQQYQKTREILNLGLEQLGETLSLRKAIVDSYTLEGQYEKALEELDKVYLIDPLHPANHNKRGHLYLYMENFQAAEEEFKKALELGNLRQQTLVREYLIYLYKLQGRFNEAVEQANLATNEFPSRVFHTGRAVIDIHMARGNWEDAEKACEEWKLNPVNTKDISITKAHKSAVINSKLKKWEESYAVVTEIRDFLLDTKKNYWKNLRLRFVLDLQGRLEMERENYSPAIDFLEQAKKLIPGFHNGWHAWHVEALARAYMESGQLEKARENYTLITSLKGGRWQWGEIYAKAFYKLGMIAEELGEKREARKQYARFLDLWKDADQDIPEIEDAKKRLEALK